MKNTIHLTILILTIILNLKANAQTDNKRSVFELPNLTYAYDALEPYVDAQTMEIHHSRHHQGYVNKLNKAIAGTKMAESSLEDLLQNVSAYPPTIRNNAGGHYNHSLFWQILTPVKNTKPSSSLMQAIISEFGSMANLKRQINKAASERFGSGWVWLSVDANKKLYVSSTANQDNPLMDIAEKKGTPIMGIDVWEHAYYLKYQNKRSGYLTAIWNIINWNEVSLRYEALIN